jgi:hypothetical protein
MADNSDGKRRGWGRVAALLSVVIIVALVIATMANPLRKADTEVIAWLLAQTPPGSSLNEVRTFLDQRGWNEPGYHETKPPVAAEPFLGGTIGSYHDLRNFPWITFVQAFWEFDGEGQLINIKIHRTIDCP